MEKISIATSRDWPQFRINKNIFFGHALYVIKPTRKRTKGVCVVIVGKVEKIAD